MIWQVRNMKLPELLAPAGNLERLKTAFRYGADACYVGATSMSLRNFADNFTLPQLSEACTLARKLGKRVYVACNAFARDEDLDSLPPLLKDIESAGANAIILTDPGVLAAAKQAVPNMELHLSTQANTLNSAAAAFWHEQGIKRVILARELSLEQIAAMRKRLSSSLELEIFVHGAMCVSYSGRCLLSNYLAGRDSNKGECAQPCRWTYELRERGRDGEWFGIEQNEQGTFILNSRDMNMIEHLPELINTGVCSLKIEGRMKSIAYVATVVNAYRMALDHYAEALAAGGDAPKSYHVPESISSELNYASHRPYTTGFFFGNPGKEGQATISGGYIQDKEIGAVVLEYDCDKKEALVSQRNRFFVGDTLDILAPNDIGRKFKVEYIKNEQGEPVSSAPHPKERLYIGCNEPVSPGDILRIGVHIERRNSTYAK